LESPARRFQGRWLDDHSNQVQNLFFGDDVVEGNAADPVPAKISSHGLNVLRGDLKPYPDIIHIHLILNTYEVYGSKQFAKAFQDASKIPDRLLEGNVIQGMDSCHSHQPIENLGKLFSFFPNLAGDFPVFSGTGLGKG